jgi:predicted enzyme related to lactoylglutathione lyase
MLGTDFTTGSPNWLDLGSPDTEAAAAFYGAVLGWRFVSAGPDTGGYGFFQVDGKTVAALGPLTEEGANSAWMIHFKTGDIAATVEAVTAGGGTVRMEPMDVMGEGMLAQATDPQGAQFALWQPGRTAGLELTSAPNALLWAELHAPDPEADIAFYQGLFGWRSQEMPAPGMTYRVLSTAPGTSRTPPSAGSHRWATARANSRAGYRTSTRRTSTPRSRRHSPTAVPYSCRRRTYPRSAGWRGSRTPSARCSRC